MTTGRTWRGWIAGLLAAAAVTAPSVARADEPDAKWSALRGRAIIVETRGGRIVGGTLTSVGPRSVALVLSGGDSVMIDRESVLSARDAGDDPLPSGVTHVSRAARPWHDGDPVPIGARVTKQMRTDLVIGGSIAFGTAWIPMIIAGAAASTPWLAIPVVGPAVAAGDTRNALALLYALDAAQQGVGLGLLIYGVARRRTVIEGPGYGAPKTWWTPSPLSFGRGSVGLGIAGTM